jgi:hypothetical protein
MGPHGLWAGYYPLFQLVILIPEWVARNDFQEYSFFPPNGSFLKIGIFRLLLPEMLFSDIYSSMQHFKRKPPIEVKFPGKFLP